MSYAAGTIVVFGVYLLLLGVSLILFPNVLLSWFGVPPTIEIWIRVVGMLVLLLGSYYVLAAMSELRPFFQWSVPLRVSVMFFFGVFVLMGLAPSMLLLFGAIDVFGAAWTWFALRDRSSSFTELGVKSSTPKSS
jgi:hypothetical protein